MDIRIEWSKKKKKIRGGGYLNKNQKETIQDTPLINMLSVHSD